MRSVEHSLLRTGLSAIDILLIHDCDVWTHGAEAGRRFKEAMDGAYRALDKAAQREDSGRHRVRHQRGRHLRQVRPRRRFRRRDDGWALLAADPERPGRIPSAGAREEDRGDAGGVFNSGILATGAVPGAKFEYAAAPPEIIERVRQIEAICATHGTSIRRAALQFALLHPAVVSVVLGAVKPAEIEANVADAEQAVPPALWSDLKSAGLLDPAAPTG
jgi:D-threo-aldose 1-dehydrogenase